MAYRLDPYRTRRDWTDRGARPGAGARAAQTDPDALVAEAKHLNNGLRQTTTIEEMVDIIQQSRIIRSDQIPFEIGNLLKVVQRRRPLLLCEIGAAGGGTLAMISRVAQPDARIFSIDINYPAERRAAYASLLLERQQLTCVEGDSHAEEIAGHVKEWLRGRQLDFLFIDGDHTYEGVKADYSMYSSFVASKGIIAFHDIVRDYKTRYGINTTSNAGGVPRFWREVSNTEAERLEFVEHPWQDGYGIGVLVKR